MVYERVMPMSMDSVSARSWCEGNLFMRMQVCMSISWCVMVDVAGCIKACQSVGLDQVRFLTPGILILSCCERKPKSCVNLRVLILLLWCSHLLNI